MARKFLKHINAVRKTKDDPYRFLFRRKGAKAITLPGPYMSEAFNAAYAAALATVPPKEIGTSRTTVGSIDALYVTFYKSTAWEALAESSRVTFRPIIERLRVKHGKDPVRLLQPFHIAVMLDQIAKPSARHKMLNVLRLLMACAVPSLRKDDPTAGIKVKMPRSLGWHSWTDEEVTQYRKHWKRGTKARLALEFALETTLRRSEVVRLGPQHVKAGWIKIERCHRSRDVDIRITPELQAAIDAMPAIGIRTFITGERGKPLTADTLAKHFAEWATAAGLPDHCRLHGLKKGGLRCGAEKGLSTHELQSLSGHKTLAMIQHYTAAVDRKKLARSAFKKITKESA
jgi:integrase